jgi:hypothetical protein
MDGRNILSKDASVIFESIWQDLEAEYGRENLRFPRNSFYWAELRAPAREPTPRLSARLAV